MENLLADCRKYLHLLCMEIQNRSVGSEGNRQATAFFHEMLTQTGWQTSADQFSAMDWIDGGASLQAAGQDFRVKVSPYANGCDVEADLIGITSVAELAAANITGKIVFLHGDIAREQLMPKNFVFFNPEEHQRIIALLEQGAPAAIICATSRNSSLAGGLYPFPLIEDGDFEIPSVYMTAEEGSRLLPACGRKAQLKSVSRRVTGNGYNVTARRGKPGAGRIVISAHIDAKKGTPGAMDNATGVVVLLLLAQLLRDYDGPPQVEMTAFNGEDYYAVPGQMLYLKQNEGRFADILLNINIDGAGYHKSATGLSFYGVADEQEARVMQALAGFDGISAGRQWYQGDHSIFIQQGVPAIAVTSNWFSDNMDTQEITHTSKDAPGIIDCAKVVEIAQALAFILKERIFDK